MLVPKPVILVIDDSPDTHKLVRFLLRKCHADIHHAMRGRDGLDMAVSLDPDLILLDYDMPGLNGMEVLRRLRSNRSFASTPVIFITGSTEESLIADVFASGANDYIRKPLLSTELVARVNACLKTHSLLQELNHRARFDDLTNLPNRWSMLQNIAQALEKQKLDHRESFAVFHINFDRFRLVNESLGRAIGDSLLKEAAIRIQRVIASDDISRNGCRPQMAARLDGDEFVVLVREVTTVHDLNAIAEKMIEALSDRFSISLNNLYIDCSIGIAVSNIKYVSAEELLCDADTAMHAARELGRHRYCLFVEEMRGKAQSRLALNTNLRHAIEKNEFELLYQPVIQLKTDAVASVEALIRWNHAPYGMINPEKFIPFAEETGLILEIGEWCLHAACRQLAKWNRDVPESSPKTLNINIARQQLVHPAFLDDLKRILKDTGVDATAIHLEITESEMMKDTSPAIRVLNELREFGVKIDIDDFGTGHSSLACLNQFPVDHLKLDRSLIGRIPELGFTTKLVELVLELAQATSVSVVAEGIENLSQKKSLIQWGCEFGQGFFLSKPLAAAEVPGFVSERGRVNGNSKQTKSIDVPNLPRVVAGYRGGVSSAFDVLSGIFASCVHR